MFEGEEPGFPQLEKIFSWYRFTLDDLGVWSKVHYGRMLNDKKKSALCGADLLDTNLDIDSKKYPFAIQR